MAEPTGFGGRRRIVVLPGEDDVVGFRAAARPLLAEGVDPASIEWQVATAAEGELFGAEELPPEVAESGGARPGTGSIDAAAVQRRPERATAVERRPDPEPADERRPDPAPAAASSPVRMPGFVVPLVESAALYADPGRFGLLYRLLWRLLREPDLRHDPLDRDRQEVERMARAVRRDMHKMTAFVRFRPVEPDPEDPAAVAHIAWFEPVHHIVVATAPFFARRFAQMRWAILTPERSVRWDGRLLAYGPGARASDAPPADAGEALWLTYYASIFNPGRLKLAMMQKEMPRRYWKNLPEATLIQPLTASAHERTGQMIEQPGSEPQRRRPTASEALRLDARESVVHPPGSLPELAQAVDRCRECPIGEFATQGVPGEGPLGAGLMLVGEQPGDQEDLRGQPFVGPAGQLLGRAMETLGWPRDRIYVTNAVKHFKFELRGKRRIHKTPAQQEVAACLHWLEQEIGIVKPGAVVALGATAARALMGRAVPVMKERGQWLVRPDGLRVLITLHPSALLRAEPEEKEAAYARWLEDLRLASGLWNEAE